MICEVTIRVTGQSDVIVLSPQMVAQLIHSIRDSDTQEVVIPAERLLSRGYAEYVSRVLAANGGMAKAFPYRKVCSLMADQIKKLQCNEQNCFHDVKVKNPEDNPLFDMETGEDFYLAAKEKDSRFRYAFRSGRGGEFDIALKCPLP